MTIVKAKLSVPETVIAARICVVPTPAAGRVKLLRTPADPGSLVVSGLHSDVEIELAEACTIYYEFFPERKQLKIYTLGWRDPR